MCINPATIATQVCGNGFCMSEAGDYCRGMYFERLAALKEYLDTVNKNQTTSATTDHD
jgi:hypothetical protein